MPRTCSRTRPSTTPSYYNHQVPQLERLQGHSTTSADDQKAKVQRGATKQIVEKEEKKAEIWWGALEMLGDWSISFFSMKCKEIWRSFFFFFFLFSFVTCEQRLISLNWSALLLFQKNVRQYFKLSNSFTKTKKSWAWEVEHEIYKWPCNLPGFLLLVPPVRSALTGFHTIGHRSSQCGVFAEC